MKFLTFFAIFLIFPFTLIMAGEKNVLTLDQAIEKALEKNPTIAAAHYETEAADARPMQAASLSDPEFKFQMKEVPIDSIDIDQGMKEYMVEQKIPFPTKLVYGYKAEKNRANALKYKESAAAQEVLRQIKHAYTNVWSLQEKERINKQTLSIYRRNKNISETAYATLKRGMEDVVRASVDIGEIEGELSLIEQERIQSLADLSKFILESLGPEVELTQPAGPTNISNLEDLLEKAKLMRPEIAEAEKMVKSEESNLSRAKSEYGPDFTLGWGYTDMPGNQQNAWTGMVGISVPLWSLSKQYFGVKESKAAFKRAESLKIEAEEDTLADVRSSYAKLLAARKIVKLYSDAVVPRTRLLLSSSQEAYRSGKGDFLNVVDAIRSLYSAEMMLVQAKADVITAYFDLERAVGTSPSKEVEK